MCGFFGIHQPDRTAIIPADKLEKSRQLLHHRGPDQQGTFSDAGIGLVHTRLSLLDLSERSGQPFWDDQGRYALAYNGEIYNFKELRAQLERQNVTFRTTSDTEVLLQMLIHRGFDQTLAVVEGMYAFAFYDRHTHTLTLARDRFGIKPLYVCHHNGAFLFSSSIAAFRPWLTFEPDLLSIVDYLQGSGGPHADHSFYKGIHIVEPGAVIAVSADGTVSSRYHFRLGDLWDADLAEELAGLSPRQVVDRTEQMLLESVKMQHVADAPVGVLCSGGVDSSTIMAMASRFNSNMMVFHANVMGPESEYEAAKTLAEHLKMDFRSVDVDDTDWLDAMPDVMEHYGQPFAQHLNSVPFLMVSRLVRSAGVKAVLSGEGADECYYGYPEMIVGRYKSQPFVPRRLRKYLPALHWLVGKRAEIPESDVRKELASRYEKRLEFEEMRNTLSRRGGRQPEDFQSLWWLGYHLRSLLHRNDCLGMAASIEARFPFLDTAVVRDAVNMPYRWKVHFSLRARTNSHRLICDKWVLREVARRYIPESLSHRPKTGFPAAAWRRMEIPLAFFRNSRICEMLELSERQMEHLYAHSRPYMRTKLLHLEVWAHVCLDGADKDKMLARLRDTIVMKPLC
ncbi:MAG TPA: asparagine synthase (glutamine-hydrolyzing) [Anaerohalosphaeraceae bacterium]|nr:asparagine synthase (glutamine-hydrolyzing) [Anaerohalosphaeraceae bacterium]HRT49119.1 asparagine synthase (glutamine-hydrolyzing) [Anaerohalosphaeraceae bacterium]HRT85628.1 asparagine synthase (glutamine-hydrolyzing) [Anaerohalosphaeraceae bacterium]